MSGRDEYPNRGFHNPEDRFEPIAVNPARDANSRPYLAMETARYAAALEQTEADSTLPRRSDYFAGFALLVAILLIGVFTGFFGRGVIGPGTSELGTIRVLGTQPVPAIETLSLGASDDVVFIGSELSDQVLAIETTDNGDALLMVASYNGPGTRDAQTRLMRYTASDSNGQGHSLTELKRLKGEGVHLSRLGDEALIATSVRGNKFTASRVNENGRTQWTQRFTTSAINRDEISISAHKTGLVFLAPSEDRTQLQLVSLDSDGSIAWETSFDRPRIQQRTFVSVDKSGRTFAILGAAGPTSGASDQNIVLLDSSGHVVRQRLLSLQLEDVISGVSPRPEGGINLLISGDSPRMIQLGASGERLATKDLPYMQQQGDAIMIPTEDRGLLLTSTYAGIGGRVDLVFEQRNEFGAIDGHRTLSLPKDSGLDGVARVSADEYIITGSVRRERYSPTDLFVQRIRLNPDQLTANFSDRALPLPAQSTLSSPSELGPSEPSVAQLDPIDSALITADTEVITAIETDRETPQSQPTSESIPVIATLSIGPEVSAPTAASAPDVEQPEIVETESLDLPETNETATDTADLDSAALSRFVDQTAITQCRFTCVDQNSGNTFPMTGHFLPMVEANRTAAENVHTKLCAAAGLRPVLNAKPICGL